MENYKRLSKRDKKKIEFYKKSKKIIKKSVKWWIVFFVILFLFCVGIYCLYYFIDRQAFLRNDEYVQNNVFLKRSLQDEHEIMSEISKNEIERECAKIEKIAEQESEEKYTDNDDIIEENFYDFTEWNKTCPYEMTVINRKNPALNREMLKISMCRGKEIAEIACEDLEKMILDAKKEGLNLWISSAYRDTVLQTKLFNYRIEREKSKAVVSDEEAQKRASKIVAKPGTSEHNIGLAVDFNGVEENFCETKEYKWLIENAHNYGFIERYQKKWKKYTGIVYEPWHFRYVGKKYAAKVKRSGLCLEKYIEKYMITK